MARAVIDAPFPSARETADVLGVSRMYTRRLIDLAKQTAPSRSRRSEAKRNGNKAASRARRKSRR